MKKIVLGIAGVAVIGVVCYFFWELRPGEHSAGRQHR